MRPSDRRIAAIADRYESQFREAPGPVRSVGREAEFPVVWPDGRAGEVGRLWEPLLAGGGLTPRYDDPKARGLIYRLEGEGVVYAIEVGRGTVELSLGPCQDLWELRSRFDRSLGRLVQAAQAAGMWVLGFGIQPRTPASSGLMTPRRHYRAFHKAIGQPWLRLTTTASDQLHVDIVRAEIPQAVSWMNVLSGPLVALCANSSVYSGRRGGYVAGREGLLAELGTQRYGMPPRLFGSTREWVEYLCEYRCFVLPEASGYRRVNRSFRDWLRAADTRRLSSKALFQSFLWHDHYVWNSARARADHSTIEVRPACQQPPGESMAANALILGWVEGLEAAAEYLTRTLGPDPVPDMVRYRRAAVRDGVRAPEPASGLLANLVEIARAGLASRGRGEEALLGPIDRRMAAGQSPGHRARSQFGRSGMPGLIAQLRFPA
jgi:glutamate--cysteine ligase